MTWAGEARGARDSAEAGQGEREASSRRQLERARALLGPWGARDAAGMKCEVSEWKRLGHPGQLSAAGLRATEASGGSRHTCHAGVPGSSAGSVWTPWSGLSELRRGAERWGERAQRLSSGRRRAAEGEGEGS